MTDVTVLLLIFVSSKTSAVVMSGFPLVPVAIPDICT